jgi:predicted secreted acid phosphatase
MSRLSALAVLLILALAPVAAQAATTRTAATPQQLRDGHAAYQRAIAAGYAKATKTLDAQLKKHPKKSTVVLDVDETTMSNYGCLNAVDFDLIGLANCVVKSQSVAFGPAKTFIAHARARKVRIAFISGAPQAACDLRRQNLRAQGVKAFTLTCRPANDTRDSVVPYKSAQRKKLIEVGATIVLNIGDQKSDLAGGAARRTQLLPNPIYTIT